MYIRMVISAGVCFTVLQRAVPYVAQELAVEVTGMAEAAGVGDGANGFDSIGQQVAGRADADLVEEFDIGFLGDLFEPGAKGGYAHMDQAGDGVKRDAVTVVGDRIAEDLVDAGVMVRGIADCL